MYLVNICFLLDLSKFIEGKSLKARGQYKSDYAKRRIDTAS